VETSRKDLIEIASTLINHGGGSYVSKLLDERTKQENQLTKLYETRFQEEKIRGEADGAIASLETRILFSTTAKKDVARHRDEHKEERGSFWIFSWKVRDVHINNGESIAREKLKWLLNRIDQMKREIVDIDQISSANRENVIYEAKKEIPVHEAAKQSADTKLVSINQEIAVAEAEFNKTVENLKAEFVRAGTTSTDAMDQVDKLAKSVHEGVESFVHTLETFQSILQVLDHDPELLPTALKGAIDLLAMVDEYLGTRHLENSKASIKMIGPPGTELV